MAQKFFKYAFAATGDKAVIPNNTQPDGSVSFNQGWSPDYQLPKTNPQAKDIERDKTNQLMNDITGAIQLLQVHGVPDFITTADNDGVAFPYDLGARVRYTDGKTYVSQKTANTSLPTVSPDWLEETGRLVRTSRYIRIAGVLNVSHNGGANTTVGAGTHTRLPGTKQLRLRVQGAGSGGFVAGSAASGNVSMAAPGSSGSYGEVIIDAATFGTSAAVTVGAGSAGGSGLAGGSSSVGAHLTAPGGTAAGAFTNIVPPSYNGNGAYAVAPSSGTSVLVVSVTGASPFVSVALSASNGYGGAGGTSMFGQGAPGPAINTAGVSAVNYGSGGSGTVVNQAGGTATGGNGADGINIIEEFE